MIRATWWLVSGATAPRQRTSRLRLIERTSSHWMKLVRLRPVWGVDSTTTWRERRRYVPVSGTTMTDGNSAPNAGGGPITRAGLCDAGSPGYGVPKSTSQSSSIEAIGDRSRLRLFQVGQPCLSIVPEFRDFGRNAMGEPLAAQRLGSVADGRSERDAGQLAHPQEAGVSIPVYPNGCSTHGSSIHYVYTGETRSNRPGTQPVQRVWFRGSGVPCRRRGTGCRAPLRRLWCGMLRSRGRSPWWAGVCG